MEIWMKRKVSRVVVLALFATSLLSARGQTPVRNAVLVELFTSEGCSSCPPADGLLRKLGGKVVANGQTIIALSEHVTYWNQLGWADPFSQQIFTDRQSSYVKRFQLDDAYTPQMVINGDQQVSGGNGPAILRALAAETATSTASVKVISVEPEGKMLSVTFDLSGDLPRQGADIMIAVAENQVTSSVGRGENSGRTLTHVSVVRTLTKVATLKGAATQTVKVLVGNVPAGAPRHLVVFAQTVGLGKVLSVATIPL
jgi:hypothetical protein